MRLLIDSHALIWFCEGNPALSSRPAPHSTRLAGPGFGAWIAEITANESTVCRDGNDRRGRELRSKRNYWGWYPVEMASVAGAPEPMPNSCTEVLP